MAITEQLSSNTLAQIIPDALLLLDRKHKAVWWNDAAKQLFNFNDKPNKHSRIISLIGRIDYTKDKSIEQKIIVPKETLSQKELHLAIHVLPYEGEHTLLVISDETKLHTLEKMRQAFIANVSHELRTPLTIIHGYLEVILEQLKQQPQYQKILTQMLGQSKRMEKIIADLLLLSRLESDAPDPSQCSPINVANLLKNIKQDAEALSGDKQHMIKLHVDNDLLIKGVQKELHSAFSNLIFNAVNYTPARGKITIDWYKHKQKAYLSVKDSGIGIDSVHVPHLTERFYRVDKARSRDSGGTGLGLAIVKHVLIKHAGHLEIDSKVGKGSVFTCVFPLQ